MMGNPPELFYARAVALARELGDVDDTVLERLREASFALRPKPVPEPPTVAEYYRVSWTERSVEHKHAVVTAAQLVTLAGGPYDGSSRIADVLTVGDPKTVADAIANPDSYEFAENLGAFDGDEETIDADEFDRFDVEVEPLTVAEAQRLRGKRLPPLYCWSCGARVELTPGGYVHTEDSPADSPVVRHLAGQPCFEDKVAENHEFDTPRPR